MLADIISAHLQIDSCSALVISSGINAAVLPYLHSARKRLRELTQCPIFGCLTREGIDTHWRRVERRHHQLAILFMDIDNMHDCNSSYGWESVNQRITAALKSVRSTEFAGRWQRGDELIVVAPRNDAEQAAERIAEAFRVNELSVTIGIADCKSQALSENVQMAATLVHVAKQQGARGTISRVV